MTAALRLAWPVALLVLGAMTLATAWHRWPVSLLFAVVATVPLLLLRGALRLGVSRWAATSLLVLLTVMVAYLVTASADLTLEGTVRDVVPRLLTSPLPYAVRADLLVGPLLLTSFVSLLVGLRVDSRTRVEPVVGAAVLYVAGALLSAGAADPWGLMAVLILVVALLGWVLLDEHAEPVRRRVGVVGPVAVVGVGVLAALATLPLQAPFEPRDLVEPPVYEVAASNPLTQLGAWANNPTTELLRVRGDATPLRLVVLDDYDGRQWSAATAYTPYGADVVPALAPGRFRTEATVDVELLALGGSWLPTPGAPLAVDEPGVLVDADTGTLFSPDDTDDTDDTADAGGLTYQVSGAYDDPPDDALEAATVPESGLEPYLELPDLPADLATYSARVTAGAATPYERASAIEREIRDTYAFSPTAISGSALWRVSSFLLGTGTDPGAGEGTSEQFATSFAVVARYNGLPTRVVVGFRPGETQDDGTHLVTGEDAFAWAEVYFRDLGWVPFSPTPNDDTFERRRPVEADRPDLPEEAGGGTPTEVPTGPETLPADEAAPAVRPSSGPGPWLPSAVAAAVLLGLALLLAVLRAVRRGRHRRRGATGAWSEVVDALRLSGWRPAAHESADTVAVEADRRLGITATSTVAAGAERAAFGPGDDAADALGPHVRTVRRSARASLPWWRRWWWHLDPRVLGR